MTMGPFQKSTGGASSQYGDPDELPDKDVAAGFYERYELKEILGRGISSVVRRCVEKYTGEEFAVKIIDISDDLSRAPSEESQSLVSGDQDRRQGSIKNSTGSTRREASSSSSGTVQSETVSEAAAREIAMLRSVSGNQHIINLHDVFKSTTYIFLVFELCKNGELFDYLTSVVSLSEKKTRCIMKQLLEAVEYIHNQGIVHRDLKPENILLDDSYSIKVTDFGFARRLHDGEQLFDLCGTPGYLAPELLKASMYENAPGYAKEVDLWACGVIMYTLLVGFPPFWHRKQMTMLRNIMEGRYEFCSPEWDDITEQPKDLIRKLLQVNPAKRISTAEALQHPFFTGCGSGRVFNARQKFKMAISTVRAMVRISRLRFTPEPLSLHIACTDPYRIKAIRKAIDASAFGVYNHWVKRGEVQNRAALFQNRAKLELNVTYLKTSVSEVRCN